MLIQYLLDSTYIVLEYTNIVIHTKSSSNGGWDRGLGWSMLVWAQGDNFLIASTGPGTAT
jgi:hypothetical protein